MGPQSEGAALERHLPTLKPIIRQVCARMRCFGADADDFEQVVYLAFLERRILEKVKGATHPKAFLHVVVANLFKDFRIQRWGKWRPSAKASRLGDSAVKLEKLVHQGNLSLDQAVEVLASTTEAGGSRATLEALARQLPPRIGHYEVGDEGLALIADSASADGLTVEGEKREERRALLNALKAAFGDLSPEDRTLLRLRFWEDVSVAGLSRMTGTPQRALYSHFDRLHAQLHRSLLASGVADTELAGIFASWEGPLDQGDSLEP